MKAVLILGAVGIASAIGLHVLVSMVLLIAIDADPTPGGRKASRS